MLLPVHRMEGDAQNDTASNLSTCADGVVMTSREVAFQERHSMKTPEAAVKPANGPRAATTDTEMRALVYHGPGRRAWESRPRPSLQQETDAIIRMSTTTICGTDLHILKGHVSTVTDGRILGHEGVGVIEEAGAAVSTVREGDTVLISCITACARCDFCRRGMYSHCRNGGWILGNTIDGTQAEYVRVPWVETSVYHVPSQIDQEALVMLSDILPTGFECGVLNGRIKPGDTVAIVGAGPVGLATLMTAQFYTPGAVLVLDLDEKRLRMAQALGATTLINTALVDAVQEVLTVTNGAGVDVAIEAVGLPATFDICQSIVAPGGRIANVGVHGTPVQFHLEKLWHHNIGLTTRLVDTVTTPMLLRVVQSGRLHPERLVTHRFQLHDVMKAYDTFENASREGAMKVILKNGPGT